ncbi:DNA cytosine methyltransferase [Paraglaciecola chathamensis]|uniref:Cytosine-specific methyltransferase n=1 Tax=Paraglaciecola agarilytica NO2 TaxID=1125747 RepID=A0ABQ0IAY6_9ALTE|nr:DNA cytosine methyltransferase [Paraglaciecola agarilytica]GAC06461.1 DNA (cytosine-5-)-methyltransferase [Paraglaciecola agarilytica NO2]
MGSRKLDKISGTYIDLFSGCGGFSLGLGNAGWQGIFAVEKDPMAFDTFRHNLIDGDKYNHFDWPQWLPKQATTIQEILKNYSEQLSNLKGKVDLIAGGPPCQGFSLAGRRNAKDPRNKLSDEYINMVKLISPKYLVLENVRGFNSTFKDSEGNKEKQPYSMVVKARLEKLGYKVFTDYVHSENYGVPQKRTRFIMVGIRKDLVTKVVNPFELLESLRSDFLGNKKLPLKPVSVKQAIGDLETSKSELIYHSGSEKSGFKQIQYKPPAYLNAYQKQMRKGLNGSQPNSLRIARHKPVTIAKFKLVQSLCEPGKGLSDEHKATLGTKKQVISVLNSKEPSRTLTTLPDDLLHYSEPRILTVRENARIQSFPDDFVFRGKYTTGGMRRTQECPRYTQVGNAVPPFLGEVLGELIYQIKEAY